MTTLRPITRALISVSDKTGLIDFARALSTPRHCAGVDRRHRARRSPTPGSRCRTSSDLTGFPEMMDGRVKTLHPKVHGGLLAIRDNAEHAAAMRAHGIAPIDLLVVNLYPFEATVAKGAGYDDCIENIDIGGPAMIRAAAKNHDDVAVVVEPDDYAARAGRTCRAQRRDNIGAAQETRRQGLCAHGGLRCRDFQLVCGDAWRRCAGLSRVRRQTRRSAALWRKPAPERRVLPHARAALRRRHRAAAAGQAAVLQQSQRHRRGL